MHRRLNREQDAAAGAAVTFHFTLTPSWDFDLWVAEVRLFRRGRRTVIERVRGLALGLLYRLLEATFALPIPLNHLLFFGEVDLIGYRRELGHHWGA
jgi:hypothetical protein